MMKHFLALNEDAWGYERYAAMLKVAVATARASTSLAPHVFYDGGPNALTKWLDENGVPIIAARSRLVEALTALAPKIGKVTVPHIGGGAFLRTELPELAERAGIDDEYVLYTDLDVMFLRDPVPVLRDTNARYFAVAPEFNRRNYAQMNTGVMLMNLPAMRRDSPRFMRYVESDLEHLARSTWDQEAYRKFYGRRWRGGRDRWDRLPVALNWKPYWGPNPQACIIHFHGPKPTDRDLYLLPPEQRPSQILKIVRLAGADYHQWSEQWQRVHDAL